jgi:hypothetical protein
MKTVKALRPGQRVRIDQPSHRKHGKRGTVAVVAARDGYWIHFRGELFTTLWPRSWLKVERVKGAKP